MIHQTGPALVEVLSYFLLCVKETIFFKKLMVRIITKFAHHLLMLSKYIHVQCKHTYYFKSKCDLLSQITVKASVHNVVSL